MELTTSQAVASNAAAAQTIQDALIEAGIDLERARSDSAVYYPDLLSRVSRVATRPEVIDAARSIQIEARSPHGQPGAGTEIDARDVFGIILSITFVAPCTAPIL